MKAQLLPIAGLADYIRVCRNYQEVFGPPYKAAMLAVGSALGLAGQREAPVRTGRLQARVKGAVQKSAFPKWAAVRVSARTAPPKGGWKAFRARSGASKATRRASGKGGYPYAFVLEYRTNSVHHHWLHNAMASATRSLQPLFDRAGSDINRIWESYSNAHR